jgi:tetratricopeptide (TPR) repeat protein
MILSRRSISFMEIDPNNQVVQLCSEGIKAEMEGKAQVALDFYMQAWSIRKDDYDACIVSHYVARLQETPQDILRWNQESLNYADAVGDERVRTFYPSLYLNMGKSHEDLGNTDEARKYYQLAEDALGVLPEDRYADMVKHGVAEGLKRIS